MAFNLTDPSGGGSHLVEVEHTGVQNLVEIDVAVVALDNLGLRLQGTDDLLDASAFRFGDFGSLVQQDDIAELNLLNHEALEVVLLQGFTHEVLATGELILQAKGIHHGDDAVEAGEAILIVFIAHAGIGAKCLGDRLRLADATGLDDDVVELTHGGDFAQLLHQVHLQRAADAAVLKGHQAVVSLTDDTTFFNQVGIDIDLAEVVDNDGKLNALAVVKNLVYQCSLAAAEVAGEQQSGYLRYCHNVLVLI